VKIKNSYIWNKVQIHDNSVIEGAIICDQAKVYPNSYVKQGTILSFNVIHKFNYMGKVVVKEGKEVEQNCSASLYSYNSVVEEYEQVKEKKQSEIFKNGDFVYLKKEERIADAERIGFDWVLIINCRRNTALDL